VRVDFAALKTTRKRFMERLADDGVGSQVHYVPVHHHPLHRAPGSVGTHAFPIADRHYGECLSLPLHQGLTDEEVGRVIDAVERAVGEPC